MLAALAQLGYSTGSLLPSAGLGHVDLDDPDARIPCEAFGAVLTAAQRIRFTPNLALEMARLTPLGAYPLLDYLVITSDTVGEGVRNLARYFRLVGNPIVVHVCEDADVVRIEMSGSTLPFSVEYTASLLVLHFRTETEGRFSARSVCLTHAPDDASAFEQVLACPVRVAAPWNGITLSGDVWRLPLRRRDPVLRRVLEAHADDILARLPSRTGLALRVQQALTNRVAGGDTRIGALARELATSARTLQRRLAAEGVSYQELLDEARKEAAGRYLADTTLAISEIAYLVGYSEPAAFHRAFRRWYGSTPEAYRQTVAC